MKKNIDRSLHIILNGIRTLLSPVISIVFSFLIVHYFSKDLWGQFVPYLLYFYIVSLISNWGHKDFLLRQFSVRPNQLIVNWQAFFMSRLPILLILIALTPFFFSGNESFQLIIWIIAAYFSQSIVPIMLYRRDYGWVILVELLGFGILIGLIVFQKETLTLVDLVKFYTIYSSIKAIFYTLLYAPFFRFKKFKINVKLLWLSFPFFALGLTGFMQSKADLYIFQYFTVDKVLGEYQIISGFYIFSQTIPAILLLPYLKNIYRMQANSLIKFKRLMLIVGMFLNLVVNFMILSCLHFLFEIQLTYPQIICGFLIGYPAYIYALHVYNLFKTNREKKVLIVSLISFTVNALISIVLLSLDATITSVLIANAAGQLTALIFYSRHKIDDQLFEIFE